MTTTCHNRPMAWTNQRIKYSANDCINLKTLWKLLMLDNNKEGITSNHKFGFISSSIEDYSSGMSLLKFFAINALELSAPASPLLLQQQQEQRQSKNHQQKSIPLGWLQLAGHPESIAPAENGTVRKRISGFNDSEALAYRGISADLSASRIVPKFLGVTESNGETYLELQDLLHGFKDPAVMDIKMGRRTFLESEVINVKLRKDLYSKMISVDPNEPSEEEHNQQAITKLRYMLFRERMSSSSSKGFRIEALRMKGSTPITNLKTVKSDSEVHETIAKFLCNNRKLTVELLKRLKEIRSYIEKSDFFKSHEIVGSSVFIVYDEKHAGAWLIDFAKTRQLDHNVQIDHRRPWVPGNCEEGLLYGIDQLIKIFEDIYKNQANPISQRIQTNWNVRRKYLQFVK